MELSEAIRRILRPHRGIVAGLLVLGISAGALLALRQESTYAASARVVLDTNDPASAAESQAIADTARAIVTSPEVVSDALGKAGLSTTPEFVDRFAAGNVNLQPLGSGGVLQLTVTDPDPKAAADVANQLAAGLIRARLQITAGSVTQALALIDDRLVKLDRLIETTKSQLADASQASSLLRSQLDDLIRRRAQLDSERTSLFAQEALRRQPKIFAARPPVSPVPSRAVAYIALGGLLGLILGVLAAAILEVFRPSLVGRDALAREAQAPILAELGKPPKKGEAFGAEWLASRIRLAAGAASTDTVELVDLGPAGSSNGAALLAARLEVAAPSEDNPRVVGPPARVRPFDPGAGSSGNGSGSRTALVLVVPTVVKQADLHNAKDVVSATHQTLLGVIAYRSRRRRKKAVLQTVEEPPTEERIDAGGAE